MLIQELTVYWFNLLESKEALAGCVSRGLIALSIPQQRLYWNVNNTMSHHLCLQCLETGHSKLLCLSFSCLGLGKMSQMARTYSQVKHIHLTLIIHKASPSGTSLVAQWLRICLPMQGTRVRALVREDPTCCGTTKPVHHNYWACALESVSHNYWAREPRARAPQQEKPPQQEAHAPQRKVALAGRNWRKPARSKKRPSAAKNK